MAKTILVTGGKGLVGSALRSLKDTYPEYNFVFTHRQEHDLTLEQDVKRLFEDTSPDYVIHTAARVGGIGRNLSTPAQQYYANILMNAYVIHYAQKNNVEKLLAFSSVCAFPAGAENLHEDILHDGEPYLAHYSYAYSKRMVDVQIKAYKQQYGVNYCSVIPGNIFGENDNFNLEDGHVVPSLVHKCYKAKIEGNPLQVWGDGTPYREFLYATDVARACVELLKIDKELPQRVIVSGEQETQIKDLVKLVCDAFDYHNVEWLTDKPNGQLRRPTNKSIFQETLKDFKYTNLEIAMQNTARWFEENYPNVRL
jgi:GDP-L-fucose synthase